MIFVSSFLQEVLAIFISDRLWIFYEVNQNKLLCMCLYDCALDNPIKYCSQWFGNKKQLKKVKHACERFYSILTVEMKQPSAS